jgi:hypothetical protein
LNITSCMLNVNKIYEKFGHKIPYDINCISEMKNKNIYIKIIIGPIINKDSDLEIVLEKLIEIGYNDLKVIDLSKN